MLGISWPIGSSRTHARACASALPARVFLMPCHTRNPKMFMTARNRELADTSWGTAVPTPGLRARLPHLKKQLLRARTRLAARLASRLASRLPAHLPASRLTRVFAHRAASPWISLARLRHLARWPTSCSVALLVPVPLSDQHLIGDPKSQTNNQANSTGHTEAL